MYHGFSDTWWLCMLLNVLAPKNVNYGSTKENYFWSGFGWFIFQWRRTISLSRVGTIYILWYLQFNWGNLFIEVYCFLHLLINLFIAVFNAHDLTPEIIKCIVFCTVVKCMWLSMNNFNWINYIFFIENSVQMNSMVSWYSWGLGPVYACHSIVQIVMSHYGMAASV